MIDPSLFYWVVIPSTVVGGFLRGFAGFGGALFMLPILSFFLSPADAIAVVMWIDMFANVHLLPNARADSSRAVIVPLAIGTAVAMPAGVYVLLSVDPLLMKRMLSGSILLVAAVLLTGWSYRRAVGAPVYAAIGAVSGFVMGATSIAAVTSLFLGAGNQTAAQNRANFIVWVFIAGLIWFVLVATRDAFQSVSITMIAVLTPVYLVGTMIGARAHRSAADLTLRRTALAVIIASATAGLVL
jgi:uncharacterized membrane protein YfcA